MPKLRLCLLGYVPTKTVESSVIIMTEVWIWHKKDIFKVEVGHERDEKSSS
jgi:hypothetical protein